MGCTTLGCDPGLYKWENELTVHVCTYCSLPLIVERVWAAPQAPASVTPRYGDCHLGLSQNRPFDVASVEYFITATEKN